jgi:hypothetical protein
VVSKEEIGKVKEKRKKKKEEEEKIEKVRRKNW